MYLTNISQFIFIRFILFFLLCLLHFCMSKKRVCLVLFKKGLMKIGLFLMEVHFCGPSRGDKSSYCGKEGFC